MQLAPGSIVACRSARARWRGRLGRRPPARSIRRSSARYREIFDCPPLDARDAPLRRLGRELYAVAARHGARMVLRAPAALDPEPLVDGLRLTSATARADDAARARVLELAADGLAWSRSGLADAAGVRSGVIDGLREQGALEPVMIPPRPVAAAPDPDLRAARPASPSRQRRPTCCAQPAAGGFGDAPRRRHRLGQDRGLFRGGRRGARSGRQVLILLPEIALTRVPRALRRAASARGRRVAFRGRAAACASGSGAASPTAASASWSARARRCSCRSPSSA